MLFGTPLPPATIRFATALSFIFTTPLLAAEPSSPPPTTQPVTRTSNESGVIARLEQRIAALEARMGTSGPINLTSSPWNDARAFGAVGDGTHDDGAAIQRAIDVLHRAGGGTLLFPPGRYRV